MSTYDRIETDNPILDEIIYNCKLIMKSIVIKDEEEANLYETLESSQNGDIYLAIKDGVQDLFMFEFDEFDCLDAGIDLEELEYCEYSYGLLSDNSKKKLTTYLTDRFLNEFEETNNYYRKITGLPNVGADPIYLTEELVQDLYIEVDTSVPVHEMSETVKNTLYINGIINKLIELYPNEHFLKYIGKNISLYKARKCVKYGILYIDDSIDSVILSKYKEIFEKNRRYFKATMDTDAYRYYSRYYDRIIMFLITIQTTLDCVAYLPEFIIRRDIFDLRTCEYFFESNGIQFFSDIPIKYQQRLIKNINNLIQYKSSYKCIIDISKLFGFDNVKVFKYYLLKTNNTDRDGNKILLNKEKTNYKEAYNLKFVKAPFEDSILEHVNIEANYRDYDTVTSQDIYWDGALDHDFVKEAILKKDFTLEPTKYMSTEAVYDLRSAEFDAIYFMNMMLYSGIKKDTALLIINSIDTVVPVSLFDVLVLLIELNRIFLKVKYNRTTDDDIKDDSLTYLKFKGFNFDANMAEISSYLAEKGYTLRDLGAEEFITISQNRSLTINQLVNIFVNNRNIYGHITKNMYKVPNKNLYDCYKMLYDSLMISNLNHTLFKTEGEDLGTYEAYLRENSNACYNKLIEAKRSVEGADWTKAPIDSIPVYMIMQDIVDAIYTHIGNYEISSLFPGITNSTALALANYLVELLDYFKSYKTTMLGMDTIFEIDSDYCFIIDKMKCYRVHARFDEAYIPDDKLTKYTIKRSTSERYEITDGIYLKTYVNYGGSSEDMYSKEEMDNLFVTREEADLLIQELNNHISNTTIHDVSSLYSYMYNKLTNYDIDTYDSVGRTISSRDNYSNRVLGAKGMVDTIKSFENRFNI